MDCFSQNTQSCSVKAKFSNNQDSIVISGNPVLLTNQSTNASSYAWYQNGSFISSAADFSVNPVVGVNAIMFIASNGTCSDTDYSYIMWNGNAGTNSIMKKHFNPSGMAIEPFCMASDKANGYLLAGAYFLPAPDNFKSKTTCLIRIDEEGCVTWSKIMTTGQEEVIQSIIASSDTGFLSCLILRIRRKVGTERFQARNRSRALMHGNAGISLAEEKRTGQREVSC